MKKLVDAWYQGSSALILLTPLSALFRCISATRRFLYKYKILKSQAFPVPIIIVGNISVGGTGKTPLVCWLADYLKEQGYKPGIVSRGYGGDNAKPQSVHVNSDPKKVGDEALLIVRNTQCPMVVCAKRVAAVDTLLKEHNCDVVISDDGLQHYALQRDVEIVVIDGERRFGNGHCLPAGPLREPLSRLKTVDFIVANGLAQEGEYQMLLKPGALINMKGLDQSLEHRGTIHAVAGIGNPGRFFNTLREMGFDVIEHSYPDHHKFKVSDIDFGDANVIMTEKDAVKCEQFATEHHWYLPVSAQLDERLNELLHLYADAVSKTTVSVCLENCSLCSLA